MKSKKTILMAAGIICIILFIIGFFSFALYQRYVFSERYNKAVELIDKKEYDEAIELLNTLKDYKNGAELLEESKNEKEYVKAVELLENKEYSDAIKIFENIRSYRDSVDKINESKYKLALDYYDKGEYTYAKKIFTELDDYLDCKVYLAKIEVKSIEQARDTIYKEAIYQFEKENFEEAMKLFEDIIDYKDSKSIIEECKIQLQRRRANNFISAGIRSSVAIKSDGTVVAVGDNSEEQCEVQDWNNMISIDTYGCLTIGLKEDGQVEVAGKCDGRYISNIDTWQKIVDIAAGERFVIGLKADGTVIADGHGDDGQLRVEEWENVKSIDAGWRFSVALTENKQLLFAGFDNGQEEQFKEAQNKWENVVNIAAGGGGKGVKCRGKGHTVGLNSDGTVVAIGDNTYGQCDVSGWRNIVKVVAGDWYTVGLQADGEIVITGENFPGSRYIDETALKDCTNIVDIAAGFGQTLCLKDDGTIIAFGFDDNSKCSGTQEWSGLMLP